MKFAVILSVLVAFACAEDVKQEEGVYVLTEKNFDAFVADNEHVLVEFCEYHNHDDDQYLSAVAVTVTVTIFFCNSRDLIHLFAHFMLGL